MDKTFTVRSPCEYSQKNLRVCIKQHPQVLKRFEIHGKTFAVQAKFAKTTNVLALKRFVLYGMQNFEFEKGVEIKIKVGKQV